MGVYLEACVSFALNLVHTESRRSAIGRIGYNDRGADAMIFPVQRYNKF